VFTKKKKTNSKGAFMVDSKQQWKAWLYLLPALLLLAVFTVYPIINTVRVALLEGYQPMSSIGGEQFAFGFGNFSKVVHYKDFLTCLKNTLLLCVITVPLSCFIALVVAVCLNSINRLGKILQTIYFLPYVTNTIAIGMVFAMMFNIVGLNTVNAETYHGTLKVYNIYTNSQGVQMGYVAQSWGIINNIIQAFGGNPVNWINAGVNINNISRTTYGANLAVMVIYIVWNALPFKILILLGGLQGVNKQYYEAAKIDSASRLRVFWRITVPLLSPMIAYVVITGFIGGFKEYSSIVGIFGEDMGPAGNGSLMTMVGYIYKALSSDNYGTASAASLILFGIILVVTIINLYVSSKKVHY
jgi:multiple sugar transport system permease protein